MSSDGKTMLFSSNQDDIDRRHLWRVSVIGDALTPVTRGEGLEWAPVETSDGKAVAMLRSDVRNPARAAIQMNAREVLDLAPDSIPAEFPAASLVAPQQVILSGADGMPRRVYTYASWEGWSFWNHVATLGAFVIAAAWRGERPA